MDRFMIRLKPESQILIPFSAHDFVRQKLIRIVRQMVESTPQPE
jgi:hypothetical protein